MEALQAAHDTFSWYAEHHQEKGDTENAGNNAALADLMAQAIGAGAVNQLDEEAEEVKRMCLAMSLKQMAHTLYRLGYRVNGGAA
jgi:hypothetical protein